MSLLDEVILLDIYPARELPIEGVTSKMLLEKVTTTNKKLLSKQEVLEHIRKNDHDVIITMGAGDIDGLVKPIADILKEKIK